MRDLVDLEVYPLDRPDSAEWWTLVTRARAELSADGMCNLDGFLRPDAVALVLRELMPGLSNRAFTQTRQHNIYFRQEVPGLSPNHPATQEFRTANHTLCADQMTGMAVMQLYEWPGLARFLAATMGKRMLHTMADPLARVNVMAYHAGQALGWHFYRSEFTITLLLQAPEAGGGFEYRTTLRTDSDPNFDGVARVLRGNDPAVRRPSLTPGTLNLFRGKNTAHRVTAVEGASARIVAVFAYFERPDVRLSPEEQMGFYGRASPEVST